MRNTMLRHIEKLERDRLDRLCHLLQDTPLECKKGLLDDCPTILLPASLGIVGAAALPGHWRKGADRELSRRSFFGRSAVLAGGVVGGVVLCGEFQPANAWWGQALLNFAGFTLRAAYSAMVEWFVHRTMDWAAARATRFVENSVSYTPRPTPTASNFHNSFATPYVVADRGLYQTPRRVVGFNQNIGLGEYLKPYDCGGPAIVQIKKEHEAKRMQQVPIEITQRSPINLDRHGDVYKKVAAAYGLKPGDYSKAEFRDAWVDNNGVEYVSFGADVGKTQKVMFAKVRTA